MKEQADSNFELDVDYADGAVHPRLGELLPKTYWLRVNYLVEIIVLPWLAEAPWPPSFPEEFDGFETQDQAARYLVATTPIVVAPKDGLEIEREILIFERLPEMAHNIVWMPRREHAELQRDLEEIMRPSVPRERALRLADLDDRPLARLLRQELPLAVLGEYERRILRLPPMPSSSARITRI